MDKIKVLVCDDMEEFLKYISCVLNSAVDIELVGTASNGAECVEAAEKFKPDVILLDICMETDDAGINIIPSILKENPDTKIIMMTLLDEDEYIFKAYSNGAVDYIFKNADEQNICDSIRRAYSNDITMRPYIAAKIRKEFSNLYSTRESMLYMIHKIIELSRTEREILRLLCEGFGYKDIAYQRCVECTTIKNQVRSIRRKLGFLYTKDMIKTLGEMKIFEML